MSAIDHALTIGDLKRLARRKAPAFAFMPMEVGGEDGSGPVRNVEAFDHYLLRARALVDTSVTDQSVTLFGKKYASPFGISAVGFAGNMRLRADFMFAEAAAATNVPFLLSGVSSGSIEEVASIAPDNVWQQLYMTREQQVSDDLVRRGRDAGIKVLVITVDTPRAFYNHWAIRAGLLPPFDIPLRSWPYVLAQAATHPAWTWEFLLNRGFPKLGSFAPYAPPNATAREVLLRAAQLFPSAQSWSEIERLRKLWPGTLVLKGLVHPEDIARAIEVGADAVTVSNHGGNKHNRMEASIDVLPTMVDCAADRLPVLFDGGIRRGADVLVSLALGARFAMVGRAAIYGMLAAGTRGVVRAIRILQDEIERTQAMIGCPYAAAITRDFITTTRR